MNFIIATILLAACIAVQGENFDGIFIPKSPAVKLMDYNKNHPFESKIISGQHAKTGQFPYQAALWMYMSGGGVSFCGGSLISTRWVLTAAHCAQGVSYWDIKLGGTRLDIYEPGQVMMRSNKGIVHPNYNAYLNNDIALISLPNAVTLTNNIKVMRLPRRSEASDSLFNIQVTVSGWGKTSDSAAGATNYLNWVNIRTISNSQCANYYGTQTIISSTLCCVGNPEHSPCSGDSGGPLVRAASDGYLTQVGVVSFVSRAGCASGNPSGFVRTASFLDWINQHTGIAVRP